MITVEKSKDHPSYFVLIYGIEADTFERLADRFGCRRGGLRATDGSRFMSVPVELDSLNVTLTWIETELSGCYRELNFLVSAGANLSWSEIIIPSEIALSAGQHGVTIKILFSQFKFS